MEIEKLRSIQYQIIRELSQACADLGAGPGLLAILGSWGDTLPEKDILEMAKDYNNLGEDYLDIISEVLPA